MNKNVTIGILVAILLVVLGYFAFSGNNAPVAPVADNQQPGDTTNPTPTPTPTPTPNPVAGMPAVQTGTSVIPFSTAAVVSGKVIPNGVSTVYWYDYGSTSAVNSRTSSQTIGSGYSSITAPGYISGLKSNTQYYFRISASNTYGTVHGEVSSFTTNTTAPTPGKAPEVSTSNATGVSRTASNLNGRVNPEGYQTGYWFEFGETASLGNLTGFTSAGSGQSSTDVSTALSALKPLTKYYFRIDAQNQFGTVVGSVSSFTTTGPAGASQPKVTTNAATSIATSSATLNGNVEPHGANSTYWFEYSTDSLSSNTVGKLTSEWSFNGADTAAGVHGDITGLDRNTKYFFRLVAKNQFGTVKGDVSSFRTK